MIKKTIFPVLVSLVFFSSCAKDDSDTSGGTVINPVREMEVFIDGSEWQSDDIYLQTIYGAMNVIGNNENDSKMMFTLNEFEETATYELDNVTNSFRYWESVDNVDDYYYATSGVLTITEFPSPETNMKGTFSFTGINSLNGADTKEFTGGVFNGVDSLANIGSEVIDITLNSANWPVKAVEIVQNNTSGTITTLAQSANDLTYLVLRIPLNTTPGTYDLSDANYTLEYQQVDGNTFSALSGTLVIDENDIFNSVLSGSFNNLTLTYPGSGATVNMSGTFNFDY